MADALRPVHSDVRESVDETLQHILASKTVLVELDVALASASDAIDESRWALRHSLRVLDLSRKALARLNGDE